MANSENNNGYGGPNNSSSPQGNKDNKGTGGGGNKPGPIALIPPTSVHHDGNVPDGTPASDIPAPDLSLISGPTNSQGLPRRRPVDMSVPYSAGVTGMSGVFVP